MMTKDLQGIPGFFNLAIFNILISTRLGLLWRWPLPQNSDRLRDANLDYRQEDFQLVRSLRFSITVSDKDLPEIFRNLQLFYPLSSSLQRTINAVVNIGENIIHQ